MSDHAVLRGIAIPFNVTKFVPASGVVECIAPGAFARFLAKRPAIDVVWNSHAGDAPVLASTRDGSASFFESRDGLYFEAVVALADASARAALRAAVAGTGRNSIYFTKRAFAASTRHGMACQLVDAAEIAHVAVCADGDTVYGRSAPTWREDLRPLSWEEEQLDDGFNTALAVHRARQLLAAGTPRDSRASAGSAPPAVLARLRGSQAEFKAIRMGVARAIAEGRPPPLLMHAAFSRSTGFDRREFDRMIAAARRTIR